MELYNSIIRKVEELAGSSTPRRCPYDPQGAWEDTGSFELVMLRDAAYELGGSSKPAVNFICVTTSAQLVEQDEILVSAPTSRSSGATAPMPASPCCGWGTSSPTTRTTRSRPSGPSKTWTS